MRAWTRWAPLGALLLLLPSLLFPGALPGPRVVSADDHLSVHHAFQDGAGGGAVDNPELSDPSLLLAGLRARTVSSLRQGEVPLWNPDIYGGAPLLADGQSMVGSPVTWLHVLLPPGRAQDAGVWWLLVWTGLGTALLSRQLRQGPWGAAISGAAAVTSPYLLVWLLHPVAATFCWLPWILWSLSARRSLWLALSVAGLLAGGHPATAAHSLAIALLWWGVRDRWRGAVPAVLAGALLSAPLWLPLAEQVLRSASLHARGGNRLPPQALLDLLWPGWWGHPSEESYAGPGEWTAGQLHPGLGVLLLGLWSLRRPGLPRQLWLLWALCVLAAVVGLPGPFNHSRLAGLAAWLLGLAAGGAVRWRGLWGPAALLAVVCTGLLARHGTQGTLPAEQHAPAPAPWTEGVRAQAGCDGPDCGRVLGLSWALQPNTGALAGLRDLRGYDLPVSRDTRRLMEALRPQPQPPWFPVEAVPPLGLLRFAGVRILLAEPGVPLPGEPLDIGSSPLQATWIGPAPRAWLASGAVPVGRPADALRMVASAVDARGRPPVEGITHPLGSGASMLALALAEEGTGTVRIAVDGAGPGLVVLADAWAPGWVASVDGVDAPCWRVGGYFRGVWVDAAAQEVVLRYAPAGWRLGLGLLGPGVLLLLGIPWWQRRREPRAHPAPA